MFKSGDRVLTQGWVEVSPVKYYENKWLNVDFALPKISDANRINGQLVLRLENNGALLSENHYDVTIASRGWTEGDLGKNSVVQLWDPQHKSAKELSGLPVRAVASIGETDSSRLLVIGDLHGRSLTAAEMAQLHAHLSGGGNMLMLHPGNALGSLFPDQVGGFKAKEGEIVTMHVPESPVFSGIEPLDLAWFERGRRQLPIACTGVFQTTSGRDDVIALAWQCDIHGYLKKTSEVTRISGAPLVEIRSGRGRLLASELYLEADSDDPIARRLLMNAIHYLSQPN
jgi:hypothetical protein